MENTTIEYRGYEIEIINDGSPQNPFKNWDGLPPTIIRTSEHTEDYSKGGITAYLRDFLSYNQVKRHLAKLIELMEVDKDECIEDAEYFSITLTEHIKDTVLFEWLDESIDNLASFCAAFGIKHLFKTSRGYSQSDWADVFICWTPEFEVVTGVTYEAASFESTFELFGHWAWGDVYGYYIDTDEGMDDSCFGFYGSDFEKSGLLNEARSIIDSHIEGLQKKKFEKLKNLIKNNVPLYLRGSLI